MSSFGQTWWVQVMPGSNTNPIIHHSSKELRARSGRRGYALLNIKRPLNTRCFCANFELVQKKSSCRETILRVCANLSRIGKKCDNFARLGPVLRKILHINILIFYRNLCQHFRKIKVFQSSLDSQFFCANFKFLWYSLTVWRKSSKFVQNSRVF